MQMEYNNAASPEKKNNEGADYQGPMKLTEFQKGAGLLSKFYLIWNCGMAIFATSHVFPCTAFKLPLVSFSKRSQVQNLLYNFASSLALL